MSVVIPRVSLDLCHSTSSFPLSLAMNSKDSGDADRSIQKKVVEKKVAKKRKKKADKKEAEADLIDLVSDLRGDAKGRSVALEGHP